MNNLINIISRERGISKIEALKYIIQDFVLKNVSISRSAVLIGGCALIREYNSPRFSEDVDFTEVEANILQAPLQRACKEIEAFLRGKADLLSHSYRSWRIIFTPDKGRNSISVHVDTQPYKSYSRKASIVKGHGIVHFVIPVMELNEIISEKVIALGTRNYLNGRDLFDIYYHVKECNLKEVFTLFTKKRFERGLERDGFIDKTINRLMGNNLLRARDEWQRYLPANLLEGDRNLLFDTIINDSLKLLDKLKKMERS